MTFSEGFVSVPDVLAVLPLERSIVRGDSVLGEEAVPRTEGLTRAAESPGLAPTGRAPRSWREEEEDWPLG